MNTRKLLFVIILCLAILGLLFFCIFNFKKEIKPLTKKQDSKEARISISEKVPAISLKTNYLKKDINCPPASINRSKVTFVGHELECNDLGLGPCHAIKVRGSKNIFLVLDEYWPEVSKTKVGDLVSIVCVDLGNKKIFVDNFKNNDKRFDRKISASFENLAWVNGLIYDTISYKKFMTLGSK